MRAAALVVGLSLLAPGVAAGQGGGPWVLVLSGIGGDAAHRESFVGLSVDFVDAVTERWGVPDERVRYLAERIELAPERVDGRSTRDGIVSAFEWLAEASGPGDTVVVLMIGHGSVGADGSSFNLPGPDMAAADFAPLLDALAGRRVALVNTTSSSSGFLSLAAPGRTIVTATRSPREQQETLFPRFWVEAFAMGAADTDKDERISLLEAFVYANAEVARHYESEGLLRTEHALLDDDGDGEGSPEPGGDGADGALAGRLALGGPVAGGGPGETDPELARLMSEREDLQDELDDLRGRRETLAEEDYLDRLEELLVRIAEVDAAIRERGGEET